MEDGPVVDVLLREVGAGALSEVRDHRVELALRLGGREMVAEPLVEPAGEVAGGACDRPAIGAGSGERFERGDEPAIAEGGDDELHHRGEVRHAPVPHLEPAVGIGEGDGLVADVERAGLPSPALVVPVHRRGPRVFGERPVRSEEGCPERTGPRLLDTPEEPFEAGPPGAATARGTPPARRLFTGELGGTYEVAELEQHRLVGPAHDAGRELHEDPPGELGTVRPVDLGELAKGLAQLVALRGPDEPDPGPLAHAPSPPPRWMPGE